MLEFIFADENLPFAIALTLILIIGLFEGLGSLLGLGVGSALDSILPDFQDIDTSSNVNIHDLGTESSLARLMGWLRIGKVPLLVVLLVFLFSFSTVGYFLNFLLSGITSLMLPRLLSVPLAIFLSLPCTRVGARILEKILPGDETSSVSLDTLIGREAWITLGEATDTRPAEAKVVDEHGATHYIMVLAEEGHNPLTTEIPLLLVRRQANNFIAIKAEKIQ